MKSGKKAMHILLCVFIVFIIFVKLKGTQSQFGVSL